MSNFDFNNADEQQDNFSLIPSGTVARLMMTIRSDRDDALTDSQSSDAVMIDTELTVISGKFENRKFWQYFVVSGGKQDANGNSKAGNITRAKLRAILESSRNIKPDDASKNAVSARQVQSFWDFDNMEFIARIGIQKAKKNSGYDDKNTISLVITPDREEYQIIMSGGEINGESETKQVPTQRQDGGQQKWGNQPKTDREPDKQPEKPEVKKESNVPTWAQ